MLTFCQAGNVMDMIDTAMRRVPRQERAQKRIEAIVDAAEEVLLESGYSGLTTNAIAARAGASIGTLYQFFPNKDAIVAALAERYLECMRQVLELLRSPLAAGMGPGEWIDHAVDGLIRIHVDSPGFDLLFCDSGISPDLAAADKALQQETFQGVVDVLTGWAPGLPARVHARHAMVGVAIVKAILPLAQNADLANDVIADVKKLLRIYLEPLYGLNARHDSMALQEPATASDSHP